MAAASTVEAAKRAAAQRAVAEHFSPAFTHVGIGSGSTVVYVVEAIALTPGLRRDAVQFVPTGSQSRELIASAGLNVLEFDRLPPSSSTEAQGGVSGGGGGGGGGSGGGGPLLLDVCFDGADEVDAELNLIKGGGACLYQEKLVATHSRKFVCVADHRKLRDRLLSSWPSVPVEVEPRAVNSVLAALVAMGSRNPAVRASVKGDPASAPLRTDQDNFIVDAPFAPLLLLPAGADAGAGRGQGQGENGVWEVGALSRAVKQIEGVLSVGIFSGENGVQAASRGAKIGGQKPVIAYFGMQDGSVTTREAS